MNEHLVTCISVTRFVFTIIESASPLSVETIILDMTSEQIVSSLLTLSHECVSTDKKLSVALLVE